MSRASDIQGVIQHVKSDNQLSDLEKDSAYWLLKHVLYEEEIEAVELLKEKYTTALLRDLLKKGQNKISVSS